MWFDMDVLYKSYMGDEIVRGLSILVDTNMMEEKHVHTIQYMNGKKQHKNNNYQPEINI